MARRLIFPIAGMGLLVLLARAAIADDDQCSCAETLEAVAAATADNYAGYQRKLDAEGRSHLADYLGVLESEARAAGPRQCPAVLSRYTDFFADPHLFVLNSLAGEPELPALKGTYTPASVQKVAGQQWSDPLTGLWRDAEGALAVVADPGLPAGELAVLRFGRDGDSGHVIALATELADGGYRVLHPGFQGAWQNDDARLSRDGSLLAFGTGAWARVAPAPRYHYLDKADPQSPLFARLDDGIFLISLPSFMPGYGGHLQQILTEHHDDIVKAKGLVIDVRGNTGGNAIYFPLLEFLGDDEIVFSEANAVLSSEWNRAYFHKYREQLGDRGAFLEPVLERMDTHPGEIVDYMDEQVAGPEKPSGASAKVIVLQDGLVGSAAEAFLLHVRQGKRVVTMGTPSRGNIDYQQVSMHSLGCGDYKAYFGYPLYMRSRDLPANALDGSGIAPDVLVADPAQDLLTTAVAMIKR